MFNAASKRRAERALKFDKMKIDKKVEQLILKSAEDIVGWQVEAARAGNTQAGQYLLDRVFGKAKQSVDVHQTQPVLVLPGALVDKYGLEKPVAREAVETHGPDTPTYEVINEHAV